MKSTIVFKRDSKNVKKPLHLKNGVFLFYAPRKIKISSMLFERYDTEITVILPENSRGYFTSIFRTDETEEVCGNEQRIWIGILNKSLTENIAIKKNRPFGFFIPETKRNINIKHEAETKKKQPPSKISKKNTKRWFLNRHDSPMLVETLLIKLEKSLQV